MVEQRFDRLDKMDRVRQGGVVVKRRLISPVRVNVKELRITSGAEGVNAEAIRFLP